MRNYVHLLFTEFALEYTLAAIRFLIYFIHRLITKCISLVNSAWATFLIAKYWKSLIYAIKSTLFAIIQPNKIWNYSIENESEFCLLTKAIVCEQVQELILYCNNQMRKSRVLKLVQKILMQIIDLDVLYYTQKRFEYTCFHALATFK